MANLTVTELANHIPEITINSANQGLGYLKGYLQAAKNVRNDFAPEFAKKGDVFNIAKRGTLSVNDKAANTNYTRQTPSDSNVAVTLDKHKEVTFAIEDAAQAKSISDVTQAYAMDAAAVIAEAVEQDVVDQYANAGTALLLSDYSSWSEAIRAARRVLVTNKVPKMQMKHAQLDEYAWESLINEDKIEDAASYGSTEAAREAVVQRLSGINLFESQIVGIDTSTSPDTYYPIVYGKEAMVLSVRPLPDWGNGAGASVATVTDPETGLSMRSTMHYDGDGGALVLTMDILYGVKTIRAEHMVSIAHQPAVNV